MSVIQVNDIDFETHPSGNAITYRTNQKYYHLGPHVISRTVVEFATWRFKTELDFHEAAKHIAANINALAAELVSYIIGSHAGYFEYYNRAKFEANKNKIIKNIPHTIRVNITRIAGQSDKISFTNQGDQIGYSCKKFVGEGCFISQSVAMAEIMNYLTFIADMQRELSQMATSAILLADSASKIVAENTLTLLDVSVKTTEMVTSTATTYLAATVQSLSDFEINYESAFDFIIGDDTIENLVNIVYNIRDDLVEQFNLSAQLHIELLDAITEQRSVYKNDAIVRIVESINGFASSTLNVVDEINTMVSDPATLKANASEFYQKQVTLNNGLRVGSTIAIAIKLAKIIKKGLS